MIMLGARLRFALISNHRFQFGELTEADDVVQMNPRISVVPQLAVFFDDYLHPERIRHHPLEHRGIGDAAESVTAVPRLRGIGAFVVDERRLATFDLAKFQSPLRNIKIGVDLIHRLQAFRLESCEVFAQDVERCGARLKFQISVR